jgi:hypothetical protein
VPTAWRVLKEIAGGGDRARRKVTAAVSRARRHAWAQGGARHGGLPPVRVADRRLEGVTCIRLGDAIAALPPALRRKLMITCDGAGASHALVKELDRLASRPGYQLVYSVGWELGAREKAAIGKVPEAAWQIAVDGRDEVRERRSGGACADRDCAHRKCWIEEAHVIELTGLLCQGPDGDQLKGWPETMRVFARRERPHPGAQLTLFEAADGWRYPLRDHQPPPGHEGLAGPVRVHRRRPPRPRARRGRHPHRQEHRARAFPLARLQGQPGLARRRHDRLDPAPCCPG